MPQQIGWSTEAKLLYQIKKAIKRASQVAAATTTPTTTAAP